MTTKAWFLTFLKVVPLAIFVRFAMCKFEQPYLGCDGALCPKAVGDTTAACEPSANTAELKAWCEHAWVPWANGMLEKAGRKERVACKAPDWELMKIIGFIETVGYVFLWTRPRMGAFLLASTMVGAIHFHLTFLKDPIDKLVLQISLLVASLLVFFLSDNPVATQLAAARQKAASKKDT